MRYSILRMPLKLRLCLWAIVMVLLYLHLDRVQQINQLNEGSRYWRSKNQVEQHKAFQIFSTLANKGNVRSQFYLGALYHSGLGVAQDDLKAAYWYRQAAAKNDQEAQFYLAHMLLSSKVVPRDGNEALKWLGLSAQQGYAEAAFRAGMLHDSGESLGIPRNADAARKYYQQALDSGHEQAPFFMALSLGVCQPDAGRQNDAEIVRFLEIGHQRGHMNSSYFLGRSHLEGKFSLEPSKKRAMSYLASSAARNHYDSLLLLARLQTMGAELGHSMQKTLDLCATPHANLLFYEANQGVSANLQQELWAAEKRKRGQVGDNLI